jgi:hypothetical protein
MINMNIFFEFMSLILKNCMFKVDLNRFFIIVLINGHLKFIYALSISKVKIIIYQSFNVKVILNTIPLVNFKNTFDLLLVH